MIIEQELKERCTPDIIKRMVELAIKAGAKFELSYFEGHGDILIYPYNKALPLSHVTEHIIIFPLLIHRAVEGWNKSKHTVERIDDYSIRINEQRLFYMYNEYATPYDYANYQPESLTHAECAMLHCLLDRFEEVKK